MKRFLLFVALLTLVVIVPGITQSAGIQKQLNWGAVTTYTDNTPIGASKTVLYNAWADGVPLVVRTPNTWVLFNVSDHDIAHQFTAQAELSTGEKSAISPPFAWTSPSAPPPSTPGACSISDPTH